MSNRFDERVAPDVPDAEEQPPIVDYGDLADAHDASHHTDTGIKEALQLLLRDGSLQAEQQDKPYRMLIAHTSTFQRLLEPLDLRLEIDDVRGLAYLRVVDQQYGESEDPDVWSHRLVRRQRLTLEQSLLVAILRQHLVVYEQEAGLGASGARLSIDELLPQLEVFFGDSGSDQRNEARLRSLLEQLYRHGLVTEVDAAGEFGLRPLLAHLANQDSLKALLAHYRKLAENQPGSG